MLSLHLGRLPVLLLWICLAFVTRVKALTGDSSCYEQLPYVSFCINATVENDLITYQLTNKLDPPEKVGWMGIGFGVQMTKTHMVVLWKNGDNSMTVSHRYAMYYMEPYVLKDPPRVAKPVEPKLSAWHPQNSTTFAFQIPYNQTHPEKKLIWAYGRGRPSGESYNSHIYRHTAIGYFDIDLTKGISGEPVKKPTTKPSTGKDDKHPAAGGKTNPGTPQPSTPKHDTHGKTVLVHAFLLTLGFLVFLPIGVLTGRWTRTISPIWFKVHWILNWALALPVILIGWVLGPIAVNQRNGPHFSDSHKAWGTVIVSVYLVQVLLGRHIHNRRAERIPSVKLNRPAGNITHVVLGLFILGISFVQVKTGLDKLQRSSEFMKTAEWGSRLWNFWVVAVPFIYVVGLYFLPKQFQQERAGALPDTDGGYVILSETSQTPTNRLVFEARDQDLEDVRKPLNQS
ncbi:hypothetical protein FA15DRAFT_667538 [Coprinopsis marcescibilis]|uniref:DOMON domain-containing protein n=1 Tax=Coprinopsis marcescibilis TaxID=230819 RepID=A0A5C3L0Z5_COPMA|nr:hypothetical protein FA15DRAFT_667538 [Coprinopsis marcescibilis]